jgi:hypothetical protein
MTVKRCETCKHWAHPRLGWTDMVSSPEYDYETKHPEAKAALEQHNRESGTCQAIEEGWMWDGTTPMPLATCWDGSEYKATLHTHKMFGCVLWEPVAEAASE